MNESGKLYIVATPIGNLGDLSPRAIETLQSVDFVAAEDTRVTGKLLNHFQIKKHLVSCQKYNEIERAEQIISRIKMGENCAFCSDAGTPVISDPGGVLVSRALDECIVVVPISGPSAIVSALSVCGLHCERFCFEGFLPTPKGGRKNRLEEIRNEKRTLVFYEAPHKLQRTLDDFLEVLGDRKITICREMTKIHEEIWRTTISEAVEHFKEVPPKGEFVLVVEGAKEQHISENSFEEAVDYALSMCESGLSLSEASKIVAKSTGFSKSVLYKAALEKRK
ncbi:MAG: 16S rRNA (cytidine(1402)-2'-O)-methyltransferase [Oscillospiraceae bacterium]|nr:16S rRNA (cytidine(1402)-2'-O)-methyltransferase [Oscillospiraceae bacterium]MBR0452113.1 16S rRNA (cytidine(1402)-2'-O)-methyltransferase [Oscillospiraceae bacterium]